MKSKDKTNVTISTILTSGRQWRELAGNGHGRTFYNDENALYFEQWLYENI